MQPIVAVEHACFAYGEMPVLRDVSFKVEAGEFIGIIGPNGGGKTTLLKLITGFLLPDHGHIEVLGTNPVDHPEGVAYVPQNIHVDRAFPISVLELVLSGLLYRLPWYGRYRSEDIRAAEEALEKMGIAALKNRAFGSLSGGQMQRALIARAIVLKPKLLLLDEPCANVDSQAEADIYALLKSLSGEVTILMVTHDLQASIQFVDRVLIVQGSVSPMQTAEVCEHFALGLYHAPLLIDPNRPDTCCERQIVKEDK